MTRKPEPAKGKCEQSAQEAQQLRRAKLRQIADKQISRLKRDLKNLGL